MLYTAGKITITTALTGMLVFLVVFLFDVGKTHMDVVQAQSTATTTLTVRNIPPQWSTLAYEQTGSSISNPVNSGDTMEWAAVATDQTAYWLIVCSNNATPTPTAAASFGDIGDPANAPECDASATQWAVSGPTLSGNKAVAATTTLESSPFNESNQWYAWVCDDDDQDPRCNATFSQGLNATNSSPFVVNSRPVLTSVSNSSPTLPGDDVVWTSVSSDPDALRNDPLVLHVCATNAFSNGSCDPGETLGTTTPTVTANATSSYTVPVPTQDYTYEAYTFLVDQFDHKATNEVQSDFDVDNATPAVTASSINVNSGSNLVLTQPAAETTGFTLDFEVSDNNSCVALDGGGNNLAAGSEFQDTVVSVYRESVGSSTCDGTAGPYDPTSCYPSGVGTSTWNLSCTAQTGTCTGNSDVTMDYSCTFPLWHVADPTDGATTNDVQFPNEDWFGAVSAIDDGNATSSFTEGDTGVDLTSFLAFDLGTAEIAYGSLEPGEDSGNLNATTSILATGNVGVDQELSGEAMCNGFSPGTPCPASATSTIPVDEQEYGTSNATAYGSGNDLSNSATLLSLGVGKPVSTSTNPSENIYWGIAVPGTITFAGSYTGQNTFAAQISDATTW
jgi:hypothetical protein